MKINEMIRKWRIELAEQNGEVVIKLWGKATPKHVAMLKAAKSQIIEELQRRAAERAAWEAEEKAKEEAERQAILAGEKNIQLLYHDGEYLSGYFPVGQASNIMEELGLVKYISGWGLYVEPKTIEALGGSEFTYQQAVELANRRKEEKAAKQAEREAARQAKFDEAKTTGSPVLLRRWDTECCDPREECNLDIHYEYALPDGKTLHEWHHTW